VKCYVWSNALYGAETWTLRKRDIQYLESFEMWTWRKMQKIKWTEKIRNEDVLQRIGESRKLIGKIRRRKANWVGHHLRRECMIKEVIEGKLEGRRAMGRKRFQLIDELRKNKESYQDLKAIAANREKWRARYNM
ncbi:hypothetical protein, partial [Salmonella sp. SAL04191]|uniref:hypothetical protein n=1 Tax=Salmonella sp. SAL04191 TaxID=3159810 RepID=UPI00397818A4